MTYLMTSLKGSTLVISLLIVLAVGSRGQAPDQQLPPDVLNKKGSLLGITTTPTGATITLDGIPLPSNPLVLLKKSKPRVLRFELAGYKTLEKALTPGNFNFIAVEVNFTTQVVSVAELNELPKQSAPATSQGAAQPATGPQNSAARPLVKPFGFEFGMTKAQVIAKLGKSAVKEDTDIGLTLNTAINPHPDFAAYIVYFSPDKGLLKIVAYSKDYQTGDDGRALRDKFDFFQQALHEKYGNPIVNDDNCVGGAVSCKDEFFMMDLKDKNRRLVSAWADPTSAMPLNVHAIGLEAEATRLNSGYLTMSYEFDGWDSYVDERNRKKNSSF